VRSSSVYMSFERPHLNNVSEDCADVGLDDYGIVIDCRLVSDDGNLWAGCHI